MKKLLVSILGLAAFVCLFSEVDTDSFVLFLLWKAAGIACMCACFELIAKWNLFEKYLED